MTISLQKTIQCVRKGPTKKTCFDNKDLLKNMDGWDDQTFRKEVDKRIQEDL